MNSVNFDLEEVSPYPSDEDNSETDDDDPEWVPCGECECSAHLEEYEDITAEASLKYFEAATELDKRNKELKQLRALFMKIATIMKEFAEEYE
jgi:hypothetical protein